MNVPNFSVEISEREFHHINALRKKMQSMIDECNHRIVEYETWALRHPEYLKHAGFQVAQRQGLLIALEYVDEILNPKVYCAATSLPPESQ